MSTTSGTDSCATPPMSFANSRLTQSRSEIRQAFGYAKELGVRFESLSYEKNMAGLRL